MNFYRHPLFSTCSGPKHPDTDPLSENSVRTTGPWIPGQEIIRSDFVVNRLIIVVVTFLICKSIIKIDLTSFKSELAQGH